MTTIGVIAAIIGFFVSFFVGREYQKQKQAIQDANQRFEDEIAAAKIGGVVNEEIDKINSSDDVARATIEWADRILKRDFH